MKDIYGILGSAGIAVSLACPQVCAAKSSAKPNVVIFLTDDQGAADVNRFGAGDLCTPNIDGLCDEGVMMTQFYANASISSPSRAALFTGRYPQRAGVPKLVPHDTAAAGLPSSEVTLADVLKRYGYSTALIGKWHLGRGYEYLPNNHGFDYFFGHLGGCIDNYSHYFYWNGPNEHDLWRNRTEVWYEGRNFSDLMTEESINYIREHKDGPFLLCFTSNYPHYPLQGDSKWREYYKDLPSPRDKYAAMVSTVDEKIGLVLKCLEEEGLKDNTIVIFMSDNGFSTEIRTFGGGGSAGNLRGSKFSAYEGGIRVPAVIRYPGRIPAGKVCDEMCAGYDWFPTILDLCGIEAPDCSFDGKILTDVLCDGAVSPHEVINWEMPDMWAVRSGDYKLVGKKSRKTGEDIELFDLKKDESESEDLSESMPEVVEKLMSYRKEWLEDLTK